MRYHHITNYTMPNRRKRKRDNETIHHHIMKLHDKKRSRADWATRAIISLEPIHKNVFISNYQGAKQLLERYPNENIAVVNLHSTRDIDDERADNSINIEDSSSVEQSEYNRFAKKMAKKIHKLSSEKEWVVVNCRAGMNRSSAAVLSWMVKKEKFRFNKAMKIMREKKAEAARYFKFKNRYQSFTKGPTVDHFSWPTLYGGGSPKLIAAIK